MKNIRFEFNGKNIIAKKEDEVVAFVEELGFKINQVTSENIHAIFTSEIKHNHFNYFIVKNGYDVCGLKPIGIGNDIIRFFECEYERVEEYEEAERLRNNKYDEVDNFVRNLAKKHIENFDGHNEISIDRCYSLIDGDRVRISLNLNCYWSVTFNCYCPIENRTYHVSYDTFKDENGNDIREILK